MLWMPWNEAEVSTTGMYRGFQNFVKIWGSRHIEFWHQNWQVGNRIYVVIAVHVTISVHVQVNISPFMLQSFSGFWKPQQFKPLPLQTIAVSWLWFIQFNSSRRLGLQIRKSLVLRGKVKLTGLSKTWKTLYWWFFISSAVSDLSILSVKMTWPCNFHKVLKTSVHVKLGQIYPNFQLMKREAQNKAV